MTRAAIVFALTLALTPLAAPDRPAAQTKRPMTLVDLLEVPRISDPQLSRDGKEILFTLEKADWKANRQIGHIWRVSADGSGMTQMTMGEKGESSPRWSPDGKWIAFLARRGENEETQIYLLDSHGGEARALTKHKSAADDITWAPDGSSIYFIAPEAKADEEAARDKRQDDVFRFDENYKQKHLWKVAAADGAETRLTDGDYSVLEYALAADGRRILIRRGPTPLLSDDHLADLWLVDAAGTNPVRLTDNHVEEHGGQVSPDGSHVLFLAEGSPTFERYYNENVFVVPSSGGMPRLVLPDFKYDVQDAGWSADGTSIVLVANMGVHSELFRFDVATKQLTQLTDGQHTVDGWSLGAKGQRHVFQIGEAARPGDVWLMGTGASGKPARVTSVYDVLDRDFDLPRQERIEWRGADGTTVEGLLYYPLGYEPGRRYPLVVQTHGGPQSSDKFGFPGWSNYIQVLAAKGYAVLRPNYRGSTGYGNEFLRDMVGHYFQNSHLDVLAGVDRVIAMGIADPDRLVKMGWSGGGHMTNKIITVTDRFKAASSGAGAANWVSMYAQSDMRTHREAWFGGSPWQKNAPIDAYWNASPLKDVAKVKTPTIFIVGQSDQRVPATQSIEMFRALKANGVPTHLYIAPREPHGWTELRHRLFKMNAELDWFEKYAMGRTYTWETAPVDNSTAAAAPTASAR